jgi:hypothetical protein
MFHSYRALIVAMILFAGFSLNAAAQGTPIFSVAAQDNTAFNFQGHLASNGTAVSGSCGFTFSLYDSATEGTRIGPIVTVPELTVTQGIFQATIDFGYESLSGGERWIEINARCPDNTGAFVTLVPRQRVQSVPYALTAMTGRDGFTVRGTIWVNGVGIFGTPGQVAALSLRAPDVFLNADSSFGRGDGGRALVHEYDDVLVINHTGDFGGGVRIDSALFISGQTTINNHDLIFAVNDIKMYGSTTRGDGGRALVHAVDDTLSINYDGDFAGGVHITGLRAGGIIEENLMSPSGTVSNFQRGDVLCWDGDVQLLAYCAEAASSLVIAVADDQGRPLVFGAEPVNVLGPVRPGDLLVAAATAGYAISWSQVGQGAPPPGAIIAKALSPLSAESGQIQAFIMVQ